MDNEDLFLDRAYIQERLNEIPEIKNNGYQAVIQDSDRSDSKYVYFTYKCANGFVIKGSTLRISDHKVKGFDGLEFLIDKDKPATKGRRKAFAEYLKACLNRSKRKTHDYIIEINSRELKKVDNNDWYWKDFRRK